jgi:hypothetical protein
MKTDNQANNLMGIPKSDPCPIKEQEKPTITQKLGHTTYDIFLYFSQTNKETFRDKVMRLIRNDIKSDIDDVKANEIS